MIWGMCEYGSSRKRDKDESDASEKPDDARALSRYGCKPVRIKKSNGSLTH